MIGRTLLIALGLVAALAGEARAVGLHALDHTRFWGVGAVADGLTGGGLALGAVGELRGGTTGAKPDSDFGAQVGFDYRLRGGARDVMAAPSPFGSAGGGFAWRVWTWNVPSDGALLLRAGAEVEYDRRRNPGFVEFAGGMGARLTNKWFGAVRLELGYDFVPWTTDDGRVEHRARGDLAVGPVGAAVEIVWREVVKGRETAGVAMVVVRY